MTALLPAPRGSGELGGRVAGDDRPRPSLPAMPALDGLRGLAVIGVLLFHADLDWAKGGFLGVSTFFTLSGFLITALLLTERSATGQVRLSAFWARRGRRLVPAALAAIALAILVTALVGETTQVERLGGDVIGALTYTENWRFIIEEQSYADLFGEPSALLHVWSLAIEEQFYVLFPLLAAWLLTSKRPIDRTRAVVVVGALAAVSVGLALFAGWSLDRVYFGTDTRAAELLAGVLLALVLFDVDMTRRIRRPAARRTIGAVGTLGLVACLASWVLVPRTAEWLGRGGLALYSLVTVSVLLAAIVPGTPVHRALGWAPLRWVGLVSYGLYLFHWPIYRWLEQGPGLRGVAFLAVALGATAVLALVSYRWLEQPIRHGARPFGRNPVLLAVPAAAAVLVAGLAVSANPPPPAVDLDAASAATADLPPAPATTLPPEGAAADEPAPLPPPAFAFFGDSTAMMTSFGVHTWAKETGAFTVTGGEADPGCGIARGGDARTGHNGQWGPVPEKCNNWADTWAAALDANNPTAVVVQSGPWDVLDRRFEGSTEWTHIGEPEWDAYLRSEMLAAVDVLSSRGAVVIWLTVPPVGRGENDDPGLPASKGPEGDPARWARYNELVREVAAERPDVVEVVDLAGFIESVGAEDNRLRPDGVHFGLETATEVTDRFLAEALVEAYEQHHQQG